ncbi:maleylpyruvate isomerase N-terminal domain-containing protein [Labedaea rhizosphaerae]|uniref:Uncharacterized protein (TIGR03083 family) n=1 Tax=Labedaea rhizosphaerae TaxID=598644 RepID=A0A4R6SE65_LABRH|nr:maleylpyruvate isomerase N-terminal domain-containing protein [Labedaea rhizosphaerae]TDP97415.1 uncharacterized protein (TIGR03083 family) [Labedaea rhizosphaerae]
MDGTTLRASLATCTDYLDALPPDAWAADVPFMKQTVSGTVLHIAQCLLWYSVDLSAGPPELPTVELQVKTDVPPADALRTLTTAARLLAAAVDAATPDARGWHPAGLADASGFAAMGCDELLVHTGDIGTALGVPFQPPDALAAATLHRLFPWAPEVEPWPGLLWANDRMDLPDRPRPGRGWVWHCAPLSEWDGQVPVWAG